MRYHVKVVADVEIDAENIVEAHRLARKLRVIGSRYGSRGLPHNRDRIRYEVNVGKTVVNVTRAPQ